MEAKKIVYHIPREKQEELREALVKQGYKIIQNPVYERFPNEAPLYILKQGVDATIGEINGNSITLDCLLGFDDEGDPEEAKKASQELSTYLSNLNL